MHAITLCKITKCIKANKKLLVHVLKTVLQNPPRQLTSEVTMLRKQ